ncbi:MAG TPA: hypothetical protein VHG08_06915, partial [Longimicrobium sp.]|nr:hypothetical protein [Longimicrobium sp.]
MAQRKTGGGARDPQPPADLVAETAADDTTLPPLATADVAMDYETTDYDEFQDNDTGLLAERIAPR